MDISYNTSLMRRTQRREGVFILDMIMIMICMEDTRVTGDEMGVALYSFCFFPQLFLIATVGILIHLHVSPLFTD